MTIFDFDDYKEFVRERVAQMPRKGRGQFRLMSEALGVNSTVISQIFKGSRDLSPEQGLQLSDFFGLIDLESRYFINLIHLARAGSHQLQNYYEKEIERLREQSSIIKSRVKSDAEISEQHKAQFYSEWYYSGIRMLSSLPQYNTVDDFSDYFNLPRTKTSAAVEFLLSCGLCVEENGQITMGPQNTHLESGSPLVNSHRKNWKYKSIEKMYAFNDKDLFYSSPMSLSEKDWLFVREEIVTLIANVIKRIKHSPEEKVACLNIDWFHF